MTLGIYLSEELREQFHVERMAADPVRTLARAMDHLAKEPSLQTGDAIRIIGKLQGKVRKEAGRGKV